VSGGARSEVEPVDVALIKNEGLPEEDVIAFDGE
jgi:hypothetical protein